MSQETQIGNLNGGISAEDSKLVDSILNDINNSGSQQSDPSQGQGQQPSPEQIKMMQQQQQMAQRQQQMAQQAMAQQQLSQQQKMNMIQKDSNDIVDNIKLEAKNIMTIIFLCILLNIEQVDNIFKSVSMFSSENGVLNMQAVFIKALLIGTIFYLIKTYLL
jgi:hypothetical protein